jgi:hypothetical protein
MVYTTQPVKEQASALVPEFSTSRQIKVVFGFSKTHLYNLLAEGHIKAVSLRKKGAARGKRLWEVSSIRSYLRANMEGGAK